MDFSSLRSVGNLGISKIARNCSSCDDEKSSCPVEARHILPVRALAGDGVVGCNNFMKPESGGVALMIDEAKDPILSSASRKR